MNKRPTRNSLEHDDISKIVESLFDEHEADFRYYNIKKDALIETIKSNRYENGYVLAKELESNYSACDIDSDILEILDSIDLDLDNAKEEKAKEWVIKENIKPKYSIGEIVKYEFCGDISYGKIVEIDSELAKYYIEIEKNRNAIVSYENVIDLKGKIMFKEIVKLQHELNKQIDENYLDKKFSWESAIIVETGEFINSLGFKWWKHQEIDLDNAKIEAVDLLHFIISEELQYGYDLDGDLSDNVEYVVEHINYCFSNADSSTFEKDKSLEKLAALLVNSDFERLYILKLIFKKLNMSNSEVYLSYLVKNVLNQVRKDRGYKEGTYVKSWKGNEDNKIAFEIASNLDNEVLNFDNLYDVLIEFYDSEILGAA